VIHRREKELGASNAWFAKEIDHRLALAAIEKHLGIEKKIAA
jgi:hypothetical protein